METNDNKGLFYNVMPRNKNRGPLVNAGDAKPAPQVQSHLQESTSPQEVGILEARAQRDGATKTSSHWLWYVLLGLGILVLAAAGFFAYQKFHGSKAPANTESLQEPATNASTQPVVNQDQTPQITTPTDWQKQYFGSTVCNDVSICGDAADADHDGLTNLQEYQAKTDPNNPDSDSDGIADGDEVTVFGSNPLQAHTFGDPKYSDSDSLKGGYDPTTDAKFTASRLLDVQTKVKAGLHQPSLKTLGDAVTTIYRLGSGDGTTSGDPTAGLDTSSQAKLDRDTQRLDSIKKIGGALLKYKQDKKTFPQTSDFNAMTTAIKPYTLIATNTKDPINQPPYVYQYASSDGSDFTLTYQSETQNLAIKYKSADAQKDSVADAASQNDDTRSRDLENIRSALLVYSAANIAGSQTYVFPTQQQYKTALVPKYLSSLPKDPKTGQDYVYQVSNSFDTFTLKAVFENPDAGTTGLVCNQDDCSPF